MANTYTLIASSTVGSGGAANIEFTSIPATYTDLLVKVSTKSNLTASSGGAAIEIKLNGNSANTYRRIVADGSTASTDSAYQYANGNPSDFTANTFGNGEFYIPNYLSSAYKSVSVDSVSENNATLAYSGINALLFNITAAITSLSINPITSYNFVQYSTAYLYGISNS